MTGILTRIDPGTARVASQDGYEARQVAKALWVKAIMFLSESESNDQATERILQSMFSNALPAHEAVACVHSFLTRGLHMGSLLMVSCIAKHLEAPIVSLEALMRFFNDDEVGESAEDVQTHELIRRWLLKCVQRNRVCPETPGPMHTTSNVSIYLTSDGDAEGLPTSEKDAMLRVKRTQKIQVRAPPRLSGARHAARPRLTRGRRLRTMCTQRSGNASRTSGAACSSRRATWGPSSASTPTPSWTSWCTGCRTAGSS